MPNVDCGEKNNSTFLASIPSYGLAGAVGAGLGMVLFPATSPIAGAVAGVAKYFFDNQLDRVAHHFPILQMQQPYKNIRKSFLYCTAMIYSQIFYKALYKTNLFSSVAFPGILKSLLACAPYFAFSMLISNKSVETLKKYVINAFTYSFSSSFNLITTIARPIIGAIGFYMLSLNPLLGAAFGGVSLLTEMKSKTIEKSFYKDNHIDINFASQIKSLINLALDYKIALLVSPIFFGTSGLTSAAAFFIATRLINLLSTVVFNLHLFDILNF